jgi:hypothetical protein
VLFRAVHSQSSGRPPLWEESIVLLNENSLVDAQHAAEQYGIASQHEYQGVDATDTIRWEFVRVQQLFEVEAESLAAGIEVFSRFLREEDVKRLTEPFEDS